MGVEVRALPGVVGEVRLDGGLEVVGGLAEVEQGDVVVGDAAADHPPAEGARPALPLVVVIAAAAAAAAVQQWGGERGGGGGGRWRWRSRRRRQRRAARRPDPGDHHRPPPRDQVVAVDPVRPPQRGRRHPVRERERRDRVVGLAEEVQQQRVSRRRRRRPCCFFCCCWRRWRCC